MERHATNEPTIQELQGRQFLRGLDGKILDPRITDVLYDNDFALAEMAEGRLKLSVVIHEGKVKDLVEYNELADQVCTSEEEAD
jgi:hypothetical protein